MSHAAPLIATIVVGLGLAFFLGTVANRLRISPLVGYLLAEVAVGPLARGYFAGGPAGAAEQMKLLRNSIKSVPSQEKLRLCLIFYCLTMAHESGHADCSLVNV